MRNRALLYLAVAAGAAIGGVGRALVSLAFAPAFPWTTLAVNVAGSFVIGLYATLTEPGGRLYAGARTRQFVMTGVCGGFTTFSLFSLETVRLAGQGDLPAAAAYIGVSVVAWLAAVWAGHALAARLNKLGG